MAIKKGIYQDETGKKCWVIGEATDCQTGGKKIVCREESADEEIWLADPEDFTGDKKDKTEPSFTFVSADDDHDWEYKYKLALADYQNLLKKTAAEKQEFSKYAIASLLEDILPIYDHLKLSLAGLPPEETGSAWVQGVKYVLKQFQEVLGSRGVVEIKTVGETFDHNTMEALSGQGDLVVQEVMSGYTLNGRLIKAAKVIVGNGPAAEKTATVADSESDKDINQQD